MPTTTGVATSFIDFTRASNATVTDSDGKVKWAPHNLLTNSESFNTSTWAGSQILSTVPTVSANTASAPNNTTTADTVTFGVIDGSADYSSIATASSFSAIATSYTGGVWVKASTAGDVGKKVGLYFYDSAFQGMTTFSLTADWQLISITASVSGGSATFGIGAWGTSYTGGQLQAAAGVFMWGAHVYRSDLGGMQPNTSAYPMYNPTTPKNLLGYTEDFSNAAWTKTGLAATPVIANTVVAPNGLQTADKIVENTASGSHYVGQSISAIANTPYVFRAYAKAAERGFIMLQSISPTNNAYGTVNLSTGSTNLIAGTGTLNAVDVGNGWWRVSLTVTHVTTASASFNLWAALDATTFSYTGDGTSGIYLWGAQLSDSASLDSYSPVYGAAVTSAAYYGPRRDFDGAGVCKGLLVEEQRSNLLLHSNAFDNAAAWTSNSSATVATNSIAAPDGLTTSYTITGAGTSFSSFYQNRSSTNGLAYITSVYIKAGTAPFAFILVDAGVSGRWVNLSTGEITGSAGPILSAVATPVGNGWYRVVVACTATGTGNASLYVGPASASLALSSTGNIYVWGSQVEQASFATSYIPTGASSTTRNADVASVSTQAFPYSATEGSIVVNVVPTLTIQNNTRALWFSNSSDRVVDIHISAGNWTTYNGSTFISPGTPAASVGAQTKFATVYKSGDYAAVLNGGAAGTAASTLVNTATNMHLGCTNAGTLQLNGHIRQITYLPRRISNTELQTRTA